MSAAPLAAGTVLIAGLVVTATTAASAAFLAQRDLAGFCDGAATAAVADATTPDDEGDPALDPAAAEAALATYDPTRGTTIRGSTDGGTLTVTCARTVRIPFGAVLGAPDGLVRTVVARARPVSR